jgi:hypothetical protein
MRLAAIGAGRGVAIVGQRGAIVNGDPVTPHIAFVDPRNEVQVLARDIVAADVRPDVLSCATLAPGANWVRWRRTPCFECRESRHRHHVSQDDLGRCHIQGSTAEATGRLILAACDALVPRSRPTWASALFAAIATDTVGSLLVGDATDVCRRGAARSLRREPTRIFAALLRQNSLARLYLQGRILQNAKREFGNRLIYTALPPDRSQGDGRRGYRYRGHIIACSV